MRLREEMFSKLLRLPVSYYDDNASGRVLSRIAYDVNQVTEAGFNIITVTVKDGITILGLLALLFYTDWQLDLDLPDHDPGGGHQHPLRWPSLRRCSRQNQATMGQMTQVLGESIDCQRVVRRMARPTSCAAALWLPLNRLRQNGVSRRRRPVVQHRHHPADCPGGAGGDHLLLPACAPATNQASPLAISCRF